VNQNLTAYRRPNNILTNPSRSRGVAAPPQKQSEINEIERENARDPGDSPSARFRAFSGFANVAMVEAGLSRDDLLLHPSDKKPGLARGFTAQEQQDVHRTTERLVRSGKSPEKSLGMPERRYRVRQGAVRRCVDGGCRGRGGTCRSPETWGREAARRRGGGASGTEVRTEWRWRTGFIELRAAS
jgi:hypothetical protein